MRLWSLHPKYLDAKGLVALWRETLLAKKVLEGNTRGYTNHPQLHRFRLSQRALDAINHYLSEVYTEANSRNYVFDRSKIDWNFKSCKIPVTNGQMNYEANHLLNKLQTRDSAKFQELLSIRNWDSHPLFEIVEGEIEPWEIT